VCLHAPQRHLSTPQDLLSSATPARPASPFLVLSNPPNQFPICLPTSRSEANPSTCRLALAPLVRLVCWTPTSQSAASSAPSSSSPSAFSAVGWWRRRSAPAVRPRSKLLEATALYATFAVETETVYLEIYYLHTECNYKISLLLGGISQLWW